MINKENNFEKDINVPSKEQIIIDCVDVSKCRYFLKDTEGQDYDTDEFVKGCCEAKGSCIGYEFAGYGLCRGDKDCYFKQLARKTQECEGLKQEIEILQNNFDTATRDCNDKIEILEQECEALKEKLYQIENIVKPINEQLPEDNVIRQIMLILNDCNGLESSRYRNALEGIQILAGKIISNDDQPACVYDVECPLNGGVGFDNHCNENCPFVTAKQILDIINKAKGEEND